VRVCKCARHREFDKLDDAAVQKAAAEMSKEDRDRTLPWMDSSSGTSASILLKCPQVTAAVHWIYIHM